MGAVHKLIEEHGRQGALVFDVDRRVLEAAGFRVGIIAQPDCNDTKDFKRLGRPKLFFGVTAGNLDSMLANYTSNRNRRREDEYAPGGKAGLRPDRSTIIYTNRIKEAYKDAKEKGYGKRKEKIWGPGDTDVDRARELAIMIANASEKVKVRFEKKMEEVKEAGHADKVKRLKIIGGGQTK